ncbi:hypothetical protein [Microbacterium sp. NPDC057944]|uniref:hypothetical protein n=1 Tax=Microbacterium sp. NPDC057944 TaxID=3346286 RepID=UPI0036DC4486
MTTEHLIEKAAKAMVALAPGETWEDCDQNWYLRDARAAFAVFEEAHTPTNDEREALRRAIASVLWNAGNYPDRVQAALLGQSVAPLVMLVHDAVLAVGFRLPEVPNPSTDLHVDHHDDELTRERDHYGIDPESSAEYDARLGDGDREDPEPQGEPSDAQVQAALDVFYRAEPGTRVARMRAALRAAAEAGVPR